MLNKILCLAAALSLATIMPVQANSERGEKRLKKLLSRHIFFDNRVEKGEFAQCNYITYRGKRALTCNSI